MVEKAQFNSQVLLEALINAGKNLDDISLEHVCNFLDQFLLLFKSMGKIMYLAFEDIEKKEKILREHAQTYGTTGLMSIISIEKEKGLLELSGSNNSKFTKDKDYQKYASAARTMLRIMWFMDYLDSMFTQLYAEKDKKTSSVCDCAYKTAFGDKHSATVRTAAKAAWLVAPKRAKLYTYYYPNKQITDKEAFEQECFASFKEVVSALTPIRTTLWTYYKKNAYDNLP